MRGQAEFPAANRRGFLFGAVAASGLALIPGRVFAQPRGDRSLIVRGAYVMTMGPRGDLPGADVLVRDGQIVEVGRNLVAQGATTIDAAGQILLPGFVDTHTHMWLSQMRGLFGRSPQTRYFPLVERLGAAYRPEDMRIGTLFGAAGALSAGITTTLEYCDNIRTPEDAEAGLVGLADAGIRARFLYAGHDKLSPSEPLAIDHLESLQRGSMTKARGTLVELGLGWRTPTVDAGEAVAATAARELARVRRLGLPVSTHISGENGPAQMAFLIERGLLGPDMLLVHATDANVRAFDAVQEAGAAIALTPITEHRIGFGLTRLDRFTAAVDRIGLGIDGALGGAPDMFSTMKIAHSTQTAVNGEELAVLPRDVLRMATIGGASAIGMADRIGSLEPGKRADMILIDADALNMGFPATDPSALIVYSARPENVSTTIVDGRITKREGRLVTIDETATVGSAKASLETIISRADAMDAGSPSSN